MARKHDLIQEAETLGIELDGHETIADLEAKIAAAGGEGPTGSARVEAGTSAWALAALTSGKRIMRSAWLDNHHIDPAHMKTGIRLSHADIFADDWREV